MRVIAGIVGGYILKTRKGLETRPTSDIVKESLFNVLAGRIIGSRFLDIFAGNGGVGIEALSRGALFSVFVEKNKQCVKIIKDNLELTGFSGKGLIIPKTAAVALDEIAKKGEIFELIFLDPPYFSPALAATLSKLSALRTLVPDGVVIVEHHRLDIAWHDPAWTIVKEKKYGDTMLAFLVRTKQDEC
ncbi:MAG: Ribosomal RNA small subunit methyltransferase D [Syntrophomonadaceae bacterium]|nr:Ribosomal RNA small subunit methyltransferase D [Bacillota bacterium]